MRFRLISCLLCLLLIATGCGADKSTLTPALSLEGEGAKQLDAKANARASEPSPLPEGEGRVRVSSARRIVSLAPGLTELIYAVGAEASLLATVEYADYPDAAKRIPRVGDAFRVDMERLLALRPDLVLVWTSGTPATIVEQIKALGLRVESIEVQHVSDVAASLLRVGELTGTQVRAQQVARQFESDIAALRASHVGSRPLRTFIEVNREPLYTVNGKHVISEVLSLCGGVNVFADLNQLAPIIGVEAVLKADPEVILSTEANVTEVQQAWRAWSQIKAVQQSHIYAVSPDTTTRATPRLLQGARDICAALQQARTR